jgi:uncharacterized protein YbaR (Trm112 family)
LPVDHRLLDILRCPETGVPVGPAPPELLARLNDAVRAGTLRYVEGAPVDRPLVEGLVTEDGQRVYRVDDDIPVMLVDLGIPTDQLR